MLKRTTGLAIRPCLQWRGYSRLRRIDFTAQRIVPKNQSIDGVVWSLMRYLSSSTTKKDEGETNIKLDEVKTAESTLEIDTKNGKLVVKATTTPDAKLQSIVIEKPAIESINKDKSDVEIKEALEKELLLKAENEKIEKPKPKKRVKADASYSSLERNFITPQRAQSDFLLRSEDLESLPKTKRRSPYEQEPPITVYWRKDVEAKAISVWGSRENLLKECLKREIERKMHQQSKLHALNVC